MKNKFTGYTLLLMLLNLPSLSVSSQHNIPVDVSDISRGILITDSVDFSNKFTVVFEKNKKETNVGIELRSADTFKLLKKSILTSTAAIAFEFTRDIRAFIVKHPGVEDFNFFPVDSIVLIYKIDNTIIKRVRILNRMIGENNVGGNNNINNNSETPKEHVTGIELHDAILARKLYDNKNPDLFKLLAKIKNSDERDPKKIVDLYAKNDFIIKLFQDTTLYAKFGTSTTPVQGGLLSGLAGKVLNTDVTTFADGLARFLVKRTKEELNVAFFQRFKDLINSDKYKDAQILFPMTMETLNTIDQEIYQFENYITTLREAFEKDLSLLLENLPRVIEEGNWSSYFSRRENTNVKYSLLLTLFIARELLDGAHPGKVLENLPEEYIYAFRLSNDSTNKNISGTFNTAQLLSVSLRSRDIDRYWSSTDSIQMLYKNDPNLIAAKFYLGFLYEKARNIEFQKSTLSSYLNIISAADTSIMKYILFVKELGRKYHAIESAIAQIKIKSPDVPSIDIYNRLFKSFSDAFEDMLEIGELPAMKVDTMIANKVKQYMKLLREGNDLALNVVRKNYGSAIVNTYNIYLRITDSLWLKKPDSTIARDITAFIKKYGTFMANTVKAKTSEEVAAAIEAVALPVGSASIKRQTDFNIALNAYVGLFLGSENIKGVDDGWKLNSYGVTAPVGISISFRNSRKSTPRSSSSSIFFSIIDLGAPVSFRFKDDKTEEVPSIEFKDIISPGVFYSYGIPRVPISVNVGWQLGPLLREVDPQYTPGETYSRISLSIVVDIPLLNFYTKNK